VGTEGDLCIMFVDGKLPDSHGLLLQHPKLLSTEDLFIIIVVGIFLYQASVGGRTTLQKHPPGSDRDVHDLRLNGSDVRHLNLLCSHARWMCLFSRMFFSGAM